MKKLHFLLITFLLLSSNLLANYVATITAVKGKAHILRDNEKTDATLGLKLKQKDSIFTEENSKVQIIFEDETVISIGKNSHFSIAEYLFEDEKAPIARFGMFGGAMRIITGKIGKVAPQKFSVTTKTATIGIRGTNFTVTLNDLGLFNAYCTYGEITILSNNTMHSIKQGFYISISKDNIVKIKEFTAKTLKEMRKEKFGLIKSKKSSTTAAAEIVQNEKSNHKQLNVTITDKTDVDINSISQSSMDTIQNATVTQTLDETIASYNAKKVITYFGEYATSVNNTNLPVNGDVKLSIDFSKDAASLELGSFNNPTSTARYDFNDVNHNNVIGAQTDGNGRANILFFGPTGNDVNGEFTYTENENGAEGIYSAQTFEQLQ